MPVVDGDEVEVDVVVPVVGHCDAGQDVVVMAAFALLPADAAAATAATPVATTTPPTTQMY